MSLRCYTPAPLVGPAEVELDRETSHHLVRVMRRQVEDAVELFDGQGNVAQGVIQSATKQAATVAIDKIVSEPQTMPQIILVQALIRPQPMDFILRKATELGVAAIQPVLTQHCVARTRERPERWRKTVVSAAEQCGANWLPELRPVLDWSEWLQQRAAGGPAVIGALTKDAQLLRDEVRAWSTVPEQVAVCVGPEGDWTAEEQAAAIESGVVPVSFGRLTLRAETAAVFVMAALRYEFGVAV